MGKKKRGGKKKSKPGRGGSGGGDKVVTPTRQESPPANNDIVDESLVSDDVHAKKSKDSEEEPDTQIGGKTSEYDIGRSSFIDDIKVEHPVSERVEAEAFEEVIRDETKGVNNEGSLGTCSHGDEIDTADADSATVLTPRNNDVEIAVSSYGDKEDIDEHVAIEAKVDDVIKSTKFEDVAMSDNQDTNSDSSNYPSSSNVTEKESADTCSSASGTDAIDESAEVKSAEVDSTHINNVSFQQSENIGPTSSPNIVTVSSSLSDSKVLKGSESFSQNGESGDAGSSPNNLTRGFNSFLSHVSSEMEEVDIDSDAMGMPKTAPAPLVRAYSETLNEVSQATDNSLSFAFKDSTESEAFVFLTASLREALGDDANDGVTDKMLSRYIRWKPDTRRAADRYLAYQTFRKENLYIFDGDKPLLLSQDPKLTFLIQNGFVVAPEELVAKDGSRVMIIRGAKCDVTAHVCNDQDASRAFFYILQRMMERETLDPLKGITIILDLECAKRKNIPRRLANLLSKAAGCFPLRVRAIYVVSMPWWFPVAGNRRLFSAKMRSRIHFLKDKGALQEYIEKDRLLEEDGGIYNFDLQSWISSTFLHEVECT